ncbi:MAG: amino acid permease [Acidobacteria bacterium]|nr:amino acid permease [Acidobacteriota bacterium]
MSLFATKSIDHIIAEARETGEHTLKKTLSSVDLIMLGIGAIIGTGIFVLTGQAAGKHAGPAVILSMVLAGVVSAFAAFCYSEFAASVPISGSAYAYGYGTLGEFVAWIIGWDLILEYAFGAATVAVGWSGYVVSFLKDLGINFPPQFTVGPLSTVKLADGSEVTGIVNLPALLISVAVTLLLIRGIKESASFNNVIVLVKVLVVVLFIIAGIGYVNKSNIGLGCEPGIAGCAEFMPFGFPGVVTGAAVIFFAYIGFDAVSTAAQEARNPMRDMPIGILGSLAICTILYVLVAGIMVGLVNYQMLTDAAAPIAVAVDEALKLAQGTTMGTILKVFPTIIKVGAVLGLSSTMVVMVMGQPRVFYSMSKDGLLPSWAAKVHPRYKTPHVTTAITGSIVAVLAGLVPISLLGELVSIGTLFAFVIVGTGIIILRRTNPDMHRPFKVPFSPYVPILTVFTAAYLMNSLPLDTWIRLILWMSCGLVIYFAYGYKHSKLNGSSAASGSVPVGYTPPVAALVGVGLAIILTVVQVRLSLQNPGWIEYGIRLFLWVVVALLVVMLMYGRRVEQGERSVTVRQVGFIVSFVNLFVWVGFTYWYFVHYAEMHGK